MIYFNHSKGKHTIKKGKCEMKKYIVWSDMQDYDEWKESYKEDTPESEWGEWNENDFLNEYYDYLDIWLQDERSNLNINTNGIIAIADIGRWNGRVTGYKEVGDNIRDCLYSDCDYIEWYVDSYGRFKADMAHHDGTNYVTYYEWKDGVTEEQKEMVLDKIYMGECTQRIIRRYLSNLGYTIAKVYGWNLNRK